MSRITPHEPDPQRRANVQWVWNVILGMLALIIVGLLIVVMYLFISAFTAYWYPK